MRRLAIKLTCLALIFLFLLLPVSTLTASAQSADKVAVIVGFKEATDAGLVRSSGGEIKYVYKYILAIAASLPPQAMDALQKNPKVAYVETDFEVYALTQTTPWGIQKIRAPEVWTSFGNKGTGIKVAILDTGIDIAHPDLRVVGGVTYVLGTTTYNDDHGHGTHVAGIVAALDNDIGVVGVAPESALYAVKVLNSRGQGYLSDINMGIEWCINNGMQVISMSFGTTSDLISLHQECDKAYNTGIVLVAAAGNNGPGPETTTYPAKYSSVIAVGATDSNDVVADWSSRGQELWVTAPGVSIYSTYKGSTYATMSGTSMACPHVTGTVALILKKAAHTPAEVRSILQRTAVKTAGMDEWTWTSAYGFGRVDAYAASAVETTDFSISASPSALTTQPGGSGSSTITVTSLNGFSGEVSLAASAPTGLSAALSPTSLTIASGGSASSTLSITVSSSTAAGTYTVTVTGTSGSLSHSATVTVNVQTTPSAPQNLKAAAGDAQVTLSWSAPSSDGGSPITNYRVYRGTNAGAETLLTTLGNVLTYTDKAVTNGQTYYYQVTAVNSFGESARSNEVSATPSAPSTQPSLTVSVSTDKGSYTRNSWVYITVKVVDSSTGLGVGGAAVTVTLVGSNGAAGVGTGITDSNGFAYFKYKIPPRTPIGTVYIVTAVATATGYNPGSSSTQFNVVA